MVKISIIIPVYNTSHYLNRCVDSIINQDFTDYEIILIDDGSTDSSGNICNQYSNMYRFITTIHKENGGLSDARNEGLKYATGEYILFIDSDDYISENSLVSLNDTINESPEADVIFLEVFKLFDEILGESHEKVLAHIANLPKFPASASSKLVRRAIILDNGLYFVKNQLNEDIDWTIHLLITAKTFNYCPNYCYYYRQNRADSITHTAGYKDLLSLMDIIKKWSIDFYDTQSSKHFSKFIDSFLAYEYVMALSLYNRLNKLEKKLLKKELKFFSWLLAASKNKKVRIVKYFYKIFGLEIVSKMLSKYLELRNKAFRRLIIKNF